MPTAYLAELVTLGARVASATNADQEQTKLIVAPHRFGPDEGVPERVGTLDGRLDGGPTGGKDQHPAPPWNTTCAGSLVVVTEDGRPHTVVATLAITIACWSSA